jgi:hypothetical protein
MSKEKEDENLEKCQGKVENLEYEREAGKPSLLGLPTLKYVQNEYAAEA